MNTTDYIKENQKKFMEELFQFLSIPSISTEQIYASDVRKAAHFVKEKLEDLPHVSTKIYETKGHPIVYGELIKDPSFKTVLVYGHYDVQPVDPIDLWKTDPFSPEIRNEKIYARGASDDKGQMFMHIKALEAMLATDTLPCNIKFLIEGEEENGSINLDDFVKEHKALLKADVVLISDTTIYANDIPTITVGLRGLSYIEITVTGPNRDLHSGVYGGAVANPVNILCDMIAKLKDSQGRITIPNFYDDIVEISRQERESYKKLPFCKESYMKDLDVCALIQEEGYTSLECTTIRPSLDVNGIVGGYTGEGAKTVLPSQATAKISMRLVPNQSSKKITQQIEDYLEELAPDCVRISVKEHSGGEPSITPIDSSGYKAASLAMEKTFGTAPIPVRCGGSIPVVALFQQELNIQSILLGFGLDSDNIHSPNEHFGVWNYYKGIETIPYFYRYYADMA